MSARTGLTELIGRVRDLTQAGTAEWLGPGTASYFDDDHLQVLLDNNRCDVYFADVAPIEERSVGGTIIWQTYQLPARNWEQTTGGTAVFYLQAATGGTVAAADYTTDYLRGVVTFAANQGGTVYFVTGRTYDLYGAAADVLEQWASHEKLSFDARTPGGQYTRSQKIANLLKLAAEYRTQQQSDATIDLNRSDVCDWEGYASSDHY